MITETQLRCAAIKRLKRYGAQKDLIREELAVMRGRAVADVVDFSRVPHCIEIKSDYDTLARLSTQTEIFSEVFPRVSLLTTEKLAQKASEITPSWWSVLIAREKEGRLVINPTRKGGPNPNDFMQNLLQIAWNSFLYERSAERFLGAKKSMKRSELAILLAKNSSRKEAYEIIREFMFHKSTAATSE